MKLIDYFSFDCIEIEKDKKTIIKRYQQELTTGISKGYIPVVIIEDDKGIMEQNIKIVIEDFGSLDNYRHYIISKYNNVNINDFFEDRKKYYEDEDKLEQLVADNIYKKTNDIIIEDYAKNIYIALVPTLKPEEIFAYIPFGGFNECSEGIIHAAITHYWYSKYKAIPICISYDSLQFMLRDSVLDSEELEQIAIEQYLYCGDLIWQGLETMSNLKSYICGSNFWYFWWE